MNNIKRMTEAAMLSALFVVASILVIGSGIFYSFYLDLVVPILVAAIYLKCGKRYSILSSVVSLSIIILVMGHLPAGILMSQDMALGFICGYIIEKNTSIFDDLLISGTVSCLIMVSIDILFRNITGYSFLIEFREFVDYFSLNEDLKQVFYCMFVAAWPLSTTIITYAASIIIGKKLKLLNHNGLKKFTIIKNFRSIGFLSYCSNTTTIISIIYIFIVSILNRFNILGNLDHIEIVLNSIEYIALYFVLKDCYSVIGIYTLMKTKSKICFFVSEIIMIGMLIVKFKVAAILMIAAEIFIDYTEKYKDKQNAKLENMLVKLI